MTLAWYGHLKLNTSSLRTIYIILINRGVAFFGYCLQVPASRIGFSGNGGAFDLRRLKVMQEVITLVVFTAFTLPVFKENFRLNHLIGFIFLVPAVYFIFKK